MSEEPLDFEPSQPIKWITIRSFYLDTQASFFAAKIEAAGIPTFVANNLAGGILPMGDGAIKLQVPEPAVEEAMEIISEIQRRNKEKVDWDFRDATLEDIAYEKELHKKSNQPYYVVLLILVIAIIAILLRMFSRAAGTVPSFWDPF